MSWLNKGLLAVNILLFAALLYLLDAQGAALLRPGDFEYKDLVSVMLTTVGVVVTFTGVIIAVAAIWGYQSIRGLAEKKAEETAKAGCSTHLLSTDFRDNVDTVIRERMENMAQSLVLNALAAAQEQHQQPQPQPEGAPVGPAAGETADGSITGEEPWRD